MGLFNKKNNYDVDVKKNIPQIVYGIADNLRKQWKQEEKEKQLIKIDIKNDKSNYVLLFNKYSDKADFVFGDINNLDGEVISDISINIPLSMFDEFYTKLTNLTSNWNESYNGISRNHWSIRIKTNEINKLISGNGGFPNNWNQFIDLLVEYEMLFKKNNL